MKGNSAMKTLLSFGLVVGALGVLASCRPQTKPAAEPSKAAEKPRQEAISFDFNPVFRPDPVAHVVVSRPEVTKSVCRLVVATVVSHGDVKASGAQNEESEELRVVRRSLMRRERDVVAGEVAARLSAEVVGSAESQSQDALARYKALGRAEQLILLAEKTGANAMLILESAGIFNLEQIVMVDEEGKMTVRDRRGDKDNGTGCTGGKGEFFVRATVVGVRAKLVSLKKDDASILADIEVYEPLSEPVEPRKYEWWSFAPTVGKRCSDHVRDPRTGLWNCQYTEEVIEWKKTPVWCPALEEGLKKEAERIRGLKWANRYAEVVDKMVTRLFPQTRCEQPAAPVPVHNPPPPPPPPPEKDPKKNPKKGIK